MYVYDKNNYYYSLFTSDQGASFYKHLVLEKYDFVGRLLRPGEEPTNYSDEEDESSTERTEKVKGDDSNADQEKSKSD